MEHKKLRHSEIPTGEKLYQVQCRLTRLENRHKNLIRREEDAPKSELEKTMDRADTLIIGGPRHPGTHSGTPLR